MVLCDIVMSKMDCIKLLGEIRKRKEFADIAVILIAGKSTKETIAKSIAHSVDGYIIKPYTQKILVEKITKALEKKAERK